MDVITPKNCDISVKKAIQQLKSAIKYDKNKTFSNLTLTDLTASRLVATGGNKEFESVTDLAAWIAGTTNRIIVSDNGNGTITLSCPQDIHVDATPEFAGITIKDSSDNVIFYVDDNELYFPAAPADGLTGQSMGLLLALTYSS